MDENIGIDIQYNPWFNTIEEYQCIINDLNIDLKSLNYMLPTKALDHLNCPICKLPFFKPWSTVCGHTFCKDCIFESFKSILGEKCPLDRVHLKTPLLDDNNKNNNNDRSDSIGSNEVDNWKEYDVYPAPIILSNITDDLKVLCLNHFRGCDWVGERWSIKNHIVESCPYTRILCKCGELCERSILVENEILKKSENGTFYINSIEQIKKVKNDRENTDTEVDAYGGQFSDEDEKLNNHEINTINDKCPHTKIECPECNSPMKIMDINDHLTNECLKNMTKCTGCHLLFPYMYIKNHESHCQKIYIDCPGSKYGCTWKGQRELLETLHQNDCVFIKMESYLEHIDKKINDLTRENESLKLQMSSILDSVVQGKVHNLGYPLEVEEIRTSGAYNSAFNSNNELNLINDNSPDFSFISDLSTISLSKVKLLVKELEMNKSVTQALVDQNINFQEQINSQRAMIVNLQQQMQFMMIERRRMFSNSTNGPSMGSDSKLPTKL
jgi:hypothetical protein